MTTHSSGSKTRQPDEPLRRSNVVYERTGPVVTLTLDSPVDRNALNTERMVTLAEFFDRLATEPTLKVVLIRARGPMFCPGADMDWLRPSKPGMDSRIDAGLTPLNAALVRLRELPAVIVAAVHGAVAGGGLGLMNLADLVIASEDTKFSLAYSRIGATPDIGATYYLTRLVGERRALELLLLSESFGVERARELGLVNFSAPAADFERTVDQLVERLACGAGDAQVAIKRLVRAAHVNEFGVQLDAERRGLVAAAQGSEFSEGVRAFVERRPTRFGDTGGQWTAA
ncbi:enoyl-CoA hydratase/isomerase family protein [Paraburkholderia saeva]|uniref:1,2-epoxyphenylacetyl-CoA isomerase n=1 Tax=Paraburkholderia saeva TaxID=2777537 RepID=A0A9N8X2T1_9BURK|nr:enoyl-CoA hydratase-related protein [Paraburkholderia saeva]CAG4896525.1 1,2-epoxyphenylacetyl-CoA isomerase [Paraburkholderia saeva]